MMGGGTGAVVSGTNGSRQAVGCADGVRRERRRVAGLLHDPMGCLLVGLRMRTACLAGRCSESPEVVRELERMNEIIDEVRGQFRAMARGIAGFDVAREAWSSALRQLVDDLSRVSGIEIALIGAESWTPPSDFVATESYLIVQEALFNVIEHSSADAATVSIRGGRAGVTMVVRDDGTEGGGGKAVCDEGGGLGLRLIRERAEGCGGEVTVGWIAGVGFEMSLRLPVGTARGGPLVGAIDHVGVGQTRLDRKALGSLE